MENFLLKAARFLGMLDPIADPPQLSTKFQVIVAATLALWFGKLTPSSWEGVAIAYMGANVIQKIGLVKDIGEKIGLFKKQKGENHVEDH